MLNPFVPNSIPLPDGAYHPDVRPGSNDGSSTSAGSVFSEEKPGSYSDPTGAPTEGSAKAPGSLSDNQDWFDYFNSAREADYAFNHQEAELNRQWQEMMSNSAYQRMVRDLKAAGLNPWLALQGSGLGGASIGSGASASSNAGMSSASAYDQHINWRAGLSVKEFSTWLGQLTGVVNAGMSNARSMLGSLVDMVLSFAKAI